MATGLHAGPQSTSGLQPAGSGCTYASGRVGGKPVLMTSLLMRVVSLEGPPREVVLEGTRVSRLGVTVPAVGRRRAVAGGVVNVLHGGSFSAVAVFWVPGSHTFCCFRGGWSVDTCQPPV